MTSQILVPLDGSELSHRAIPWADAWAGALGAGVELIRVMSAPAFQAVSSDDVYDYFGERDGGSASRGSDQRLGDRVQRSADPGSP